VKRKPKEIMTATPVAVFGSGRMAVFDKKGAIVKEVNLRPVKKTKPKLHGRVPEMGDRVLLDDVKEVGLTIKEPKGGAAIRKFKTSRGLLGTTNAPIAPPAPQEPPPVHVSGPDKLYDKYVIIRIDGSPKHKGCKLFALDLDHDPAGVAAAMLYAKLVEGKKPGLAKDLRAVCYGGYIGVQCEGKKCDGRGRVHTGENVCMTCSSR
jgi:hypothetical protein